MAKLGLPLLVPAVGLPAVLSLAQETNYDLSLTQVIFGGIFKSFNRGVEGDNFCQIRTTEYKDLIKTDSKY